MVDRWYFRYVLLVRLSMSSTSAVCLGAAWARLKKYRTHRIETANHSVRGGCLITEYNESALCRE